MLVLFQEGIPDLFFPALEKAGWRISRFATEPVPARDKFREHSDAEAVFFRANFALGQTELDLLPKLKLAALVSTGSDNLDYAALAGRGVKLVSGEGANSQAVCDYVMQALLFGGFDVQRHSVGVVGTGFVGSKVLRILKTASVRTAHYDPLMQDRGSLADVLTCDFITFHTPLTKTGLHSTAGMLNAAYFSPVTKKTRIIQTCRGGIWDKGFYEALATHQHLELLAQDVYPIEPPLTTDLGRAKFSTPHIAGYSTHGRLGGILKGIQALISGFSGGEAMPVGKAWFLDEESRAFAAQPGAFSKIRDNYGWRKEFSEYNAAEQAAFRAKFPDVTASFIDNLFDKRTFPPEKRLIPDA